MIRSKHLLNKNELTVQKIKGLPFKSVIFLLGNLFDPDLAGMYAIFFKIDYLVKPEFNLLFQKIDRQ